MSWLQLHNSQVLALSAIVQAAATIVLVVVTLAYVLFTRSLAKEAQKQAVAAQAQADAAREALDRAFEDGVRQQAQLVQRQTVLGARSDLTQLLAKSIEWTMRAAVTVRSLKREGGLRFVEEPDGYLVRLFGDRCRALSVDESACDLSYLEDFVGAFPLSDELVDDLYAAGSLATGAASMLDMKLDMAQAGLSPQASEVLGLVDSLGRISQPLLHALEALRQAVRTSGYARAFGTLPLDSGHTVIATEWIVARGGSWHLGESLRTQLLDKTGS